MMRIRWIGLGMVSALAFGCPGKDDARDKDTPRDMQGEAGASGAQDLGDAGVRPGDDAAADDEATGGGVGVDGGPNAKDAEVEAEGPDGLAKVLEGAIENVCRDDVMLSASGRLLVYSDCSDTLLDKHFLRPLSTDESIVVPGGDPNGHAGVFSADESKFVYREQTALGINVRVMSTDGAEVMTLAETQYVSALNVTRSNRVVWIEGGGKLLSVPLAGGDVTTLLDLTGTGERFMQFEPYVVIPDGTKLVYRLDGDDELMIVPTDGSAAPSEVFSAMKSNPQWSTLTNDSIFVSVLGETGYDMLLVSLSDGKTTPVAENVPQLAAYRDGRAYWVANNYKDLWQWKVGEESPTEAFAQNAMSIIISSDGSLIVWYDPVNMKMMSAPSDGSAEAIAIMDIADGAHMVELSPDLTRIVVTDGESLKLAEVAKPGSGTVIEVAGVSRTDAIGWNGTSTHALYFKNSEGSGYDTSDSLWAVEASSGKPALLSSDVYQWFKVHQSASILFTSNVEGITDVVSTLHIVTP